jgi:hypothetical protein
MAEVSTVSSVEIANIETIGGVNSSDIDSVDGVDFVTGFTNVYALRQLVSPQTGSMQVANPSSYHFTTGGSDDPFSISAWVNADTMKRFRIASKGNVAYGATSAAQEWVLSFGDPPWYAPTDPPPIDFKLFGDAGGSVYIQQYGGSFNITGSWNHVVATYDGSGGTSGMKIYFNAVSSSATNPFSAGSYSSLNDSSQPLVIGGYLGNSDRFKGYLDEVSIWTKELTSADVTDIYNSGSPGDLSTSGSLLSWWRMGDNNGGTGTTITDVQGTGDGSLNNSGGPGGAGSFASGDGISSEKVP